MTKTKKRTSRFYVEQDGLYETSDLSPSPKKKNRQKQIKAIDAEQTSHQKIIAVYAPIDDVAIITEDETPAGELWDERIEKDT